MYRRNLCRKRVSRSSAGAVWLSLLSCIESSPIGGVCHFLFLLCYVWKTRVCVLCEDDLFTEGVCLSLSLISYVEYNFWRAIIFKKSGLDYWRIKIEVAWFCVASTSIRTGTAATLFRLCCCCCFCCYCYFFCCCCCWCVLFPAKSGRLLRDLTVVANMSVIRDFCSNTMEMIFSPAREGRASRR